MLITIFVFFVLLIQNFCYASELIVNKAPLVVENQDNFIKILNDKMFISYRTTRNDGTFDLFLGKVSSKGEVIENIHIDLQGMKPLSTEIIGLRDDKILLFCSVKANDGSKYLYLIESSDNGKTFKRKNILNATRDVLNPIVATSSGSNVYVVWIDERDNKRHGLYLNYSNDRGETFQKNDILLTEGFSSVGIPRLIADKDKVHLFFSGAGADNPAGIFYRFSKDAGKTWSEVIRVTTYEPNWQPSDIKIINSKDGSLQVFWYGRGIYMASSKDGKDWTQKMIKNAGDEEFVFNMKAISGMNDEIYLVYDFGFLVYAYHRVNRPNLYFIKSQDKGVSWSTPRMIRGYKYTSTSAFMPNIFQSEDRKLILVAWTDHRYIRGSIYINYSLDGGDTWHDKSFTVEDEPGKYHSFAPVLTPFGGDYYVTWQRARDDSRSKIDLVLKKIRLSDYMKMHGR